MIWNLIKGYALCLHEQLSWSKVELDPLGVLVTWSAASRLPDHWMQPSPGNWFKSYFSPPPCLSFHPFSPPRIQSSYIQSVSHVCPFTQIPSRCTVMWRSTWLQKPWSLARPDQLSFSWKISVTGGPQRAPLQILRVTSLSNRSLE